MKDTTSQTKEHSQQEQSKEIRKTSSTFPASKAFHSHDDQVHIPLGPGQQNIDQTVVASKAHVAAAPSKSRILLGIFFSGYDNQLRYVHRATYLNYFSKHHTSPPNRTCTLQQFEELLQTTQDHSHFVNNDHPGLSETCRLVYTFLMDGTQRWDPRLIKNVLNRGREPDVLILDPKIYPIPLPTSTSLLIPSWVRWYQFAMDQHQKWAEQQHQSNQLAVDMSDFDFVAHTDCSVQLHPEEFWKDNSFLKTVQWNRSNVFAQGNGFTLLSTDLVKNVVIPTSKNTTKAGGKDGKNWLTNILGNDLSQPVSPQPFKGISPVAKYE